MTKPVYKKGEITIAAFKKKCKAAGYVYDPKAKGRCRKPKPKGRKKKCTPPKISVRAYTRRLRNGKTKKFPASCAKKGKRGRPKKSA